MTLSTEGVDRRAVALALGRALAATVAVVVLYFVLPLDQVRRWPPAVSLGLALIGYVGLMVFEIRHTARAARPAFRGIQAIGVLASVYLVVFAADYHVMSLRDAGAFDESHLSRLDALYLAVATFTTVGFGDIAATSPPARATVTVQMVANLVLIGFAVRAVVAAVRQATDLSDGR